jgi:hypothetical protein
MINFEVICVKDSKSGRIKLKKTRFFLEIEDSDINITFGAFLQKYGEKILQRSFQNKKLSDFKANGMVSFPMRLGGMDSSSMKSGMKYDESLVFKRDNKTKTISEITTRVLLLQNIPQGAESSFNQNVGSDTLISSREETYELRKDYTQKMDPDGRPTGEFMDPDDVLDVRIIFIHENLEYDSFFSFPKADVEGISFGMFLWKYGKDILDLYRNANLDIPSWEKGPSFPMELRILEIFDSGDSFCNGNRDQTLLWTGIDENILILKKIWNQEENAKYFDAAVAIPEEHPPECTICFGNLHHPVFAFDVNHGGYSTSLMLPRIPSNDIITLHCGHNFHTHCVLKACSHNFYKCMRCTLNPGNEWWRKKFDMLQRYLCCCQNQAHDDLREFEMQLSSRRWELEDAEQHFARALSKDKSSAITRSGDREMNDNKRTNESLLQEYLAKQRSLTSQIITLEKEIPNYRLIADVVKKEWEFIKSKIDSDSPLYLRAQMAQEYGIPNPNGFQRLNLLLDRVI